MVYSIRGGDVCIWIFISISEVMAEILIQLVISYWFTLAITSPLEHGRWWVATFPSMISDDRQYSASLHLMRRDSGLRSCWKQLDQIQGML